MATIERTLTMREFRLHGGDTVDLAGYASVRDPRGDFTADKEGHQQFYGVFKTLSGARARVRRESAFAAECGATLTIEHHDAVGVYVVLWVNP